MSSHIAEERLLNSGVIQYLIFSLYQFLLADWMGIIVVQNMTKILTLYFTMPVLQLATIIIESAKLIGLEEC